MLSKSDISFVEFYQSFLLGNFFHLLRFTLEIVTRNITSISLKIRILNHCNDKLDGIKPNHNKNLHRFVNYKGHTVKAYEGIINFAL